MKENTFLLEWMSRLLEWLGLNSAEGGYKSLFATEKVATLSDDTLLATYHPMEDRMIVVILNHFAQEKAFTLTPHDGYRITNVLYGEPQKIGAYDACVLELKKA